MKPVTFDDLIGQTFHFYGVAGRMFKLDDMIFEAVRAETLGWGDSYYDDEPRTGYCLEKIIQINPSSIPASSFLSLPFARVLVCREGSLWEYGNGHRDLDFNGYSLVDVDQPNHEWLMVGTQSSCNFHFDFKPSEAVKPLLAIEDPVAKAAALAGFLLEQKRLNE